MLSTAVIEKAKLISKYTQIYCEKHGGRDHKPGDVLPYLVEMNVFNQVDSRNGRDLRAVLREVNKAEKLAELIPQCRAEQRNVNIMWFFNKA